MKLNYLVFLFILISKTTFADEQFRSHLSFIFSDLEIQEDDQNQESLIILNDLLSIHQTNRPILPVKDIKIFIPTGYDIGDIQIISNNSEKIALKYAPKLSSNLRPFSIPSYKNKNPPAFLDTNTAVFPNQEKNYSIQYLAGLKIAFLPLYPVQYLTKTNDLLFHKNIDVLVSFKKSKSHKEFLNPPRLHQMDIERLSSLVDNKDDTSHFSLIKNSKSKVEYLIITHQRWMETKPPYNLDALLSQKQKSGLSGQIITTQEIEENFSGNSLQEKIRNTIKEYHKSLGTNYVLLVGDWDKEPNSAIPAVGFIAEAEGITDNNIPADMYYSNLDGDFDYNKNNILGEPTDGPDGKEVDLISEVFIGRVSIDSQTELSNYIKKTLYYENLDSQTAYLNNVILAGEYLWDSSINGPQWGSDMMEELFNYSSAHGIETVGIPKDKNFFRFYEKNNTYKVSDIKKAINDGVHYINHVGHSSNMGNMKMTIKDVKAFKNDNRYFFGYTQGCYAGAFDNRDGWGWDGWSDGILEEMISAPVGAFAYIGNTRYGWGDDHTTKGPGQMYHRHFIDARFGKNILELGKLNQFSKEKNIGRINDTAMRWTYYELTLFGDPALKLK